MERKPYTNNGPTFGHFIPSDGGGRNKEGKRLGYTEVVKRGQIAHLTDQEYAAHSDQFSTHIDLRMITHVNDQAAMRVIKDTTDLGSLTTIYNAESRRRGKGMKPRKEVLDAIEERKSELESGSPATDLPKQKTKK